MKNLTVRARIVLGFSVVILIMLGIGGLAFNHLNEIRLETQELSETTLPATWTIAELDSTSTDEYALTEQALLSTDPSRVAQAKLDVETKAKDIDKLLQDYDKTVPRDGGKAAQLFEKVKAARTAYVQVRANAFARASGVTTGTVDAAYHAYDDSLTDQANANHESATASGGHIRDTVMSAQRAIAIGLLLSLVLATVSGFLLVNAINQPLSLVVDAIEPMRQGDLSQRLSLARNDEFGVLSQGLNRLADDLTSIIGQVQKATIQVNTSVTEIAATAREQQATASEIAATTTEVGATSKEISATSKELVKSMNEVSSVAERTAELAASSQSGLSRMEATMHQIMDASGSINDRLTVLNEKAGNINTVVTTIAKVADQTNLLSLNAAIEAEKAGEYGRGFAVVASEIRRLADQTAVATLDIEQMVKEMQSAVSAGVMGLDKFSEAVRRGVEVVGTVGGQLTQIIQQVQTLTPNFEAVNEGMQSQSLGAQQISDALSQLSEAAQQTVESLRQSNMAIEQLNEAVRGLQSSVSRFTLAD